MPLTRRVTRAAWIAGGVVWVAAVVVGFGTLSAFAARPGTAGGAHVAEMTPPEIFEASASF